MLTVQTTHGTETQKLIDLHVENNEQQLVDFPLKSTVSLYFILPTRTPKSISARKQGKS